MVGMTKIILQPGQFIYGRSKASMETGIKQTTLTDCMEWLKSNNTIAINPTTKYSIITLINWALYQFQENEPDNSPTTNPTTTQQQADTNKNTKNNKKFKKLSLSELPSDAVKLSKYLRANILEWKPNARVPKTDNELIPWAKVIRLMIDRDSRKPDDIATIIEWATHDTRFWQANIMSAIKLREKYDQLEAKMNQDKSNKGYAR